MSIMFGNFTILGRKNVETAIEFYKYITNIGTKLAKNGLRLYGLNLKNLSFKLGSQTESDTNQAPNRLLQAKVSMC